MQLLDAYGNWAPTINQEDWIPGNSTSGGGVLSGAGVPDNAEGDNGNIYVNLTNGDVYSKSGDVWILQGAGASGSNLLGVVDPNGAVTPDAVGQFYTNTAAVPLPQLWQAEGLTNADWFLRT